MFFHPHPPSFRCGGLYIYTPPRSYIPATRISHSPKPNYITHFFLISIAWVNQRSAYLNPPIHPKTDSCVLRFFPCPFSIPHGFPPPQHPGETWDILISNREQDVGLGGGGGDDDGDENKKYIIQTTEYKPTYPQTPLTASCFQPFTLSSFRVPPLPFIPPPFLSQHPSTSPQPNPTHPVNLYNPRSKSKSKSQKNEFLKRNGNGI